MKISRRDFIHAGCGVAVATLNPNRADAILGRGGPVPSFTGKTVVNVGASPLAFINIGKGLNLVGSTANWPGQLNANGYPSGSSFPGATSGSLPLDSSYYGRYRIWWTGNGGIGFNPPAIIYSGGSSVVGLGASTGSTSTNVGIGFTTGQPSQASLVEFSFGVLISTFVNNTGLVQFTAAASAPFSAGVFGTDNTVNLALSSIVGNGTTATATTTAPHGIPVGISIPMVISGATPSGFNNSGASVLCTSTGASTFTYPNATNATASIPGTYSPQIAFFQFNNVTGLGTAPNSDGSWTAWRIDNQNFVLPQSAAVVGSVAIVGGGAGTQSEAILSIRRNPTSGLSTTFPASASVTGGSYTWSGFNWYRKNDEASLLAGQLVSPAYFAALKGPSGLNPRFIRFMDFTAVQGDLSSNFTYRTQTTSWSWGITINNPAYYAGTITNGGSDAYTCANPSASGSGAYVDGEVVCGQISGANTTNNPTLNVNSRGVAPIFGTGGGGNTSNSSLVNLFLTGSPPAAGQTVTFHFSGGGLGSPYSPVYTVTSGAAGSLSALGAAIKTFLAADSTLAAAGIVIPAAGGEPTGFFNIEYNPNIGGLGASALTASASDSQSAATYSFGKVGIGRYANNVYVAFTYSALFGGFVCTSPSQLSTQSGAGVHGGPPLEFYADFAIRANVGMWLNIGQFWSASRISSTVTLLANLGVKELYLEYSNETWNSAEQEWSIATTTGNCLGLSDSGNPTTSANGATGLRTAQIAQLAAAAWTSAGRSRSQLYIGLQYQFVDMNSSGTTNTCTRRMQGTNLNTSTNATLVSFGGMGATSLSFNPSASGTRPIDYADAIGGAPYWCGAEFNINNGGTTLNTSVPLSSYNGALLAAYNYAYGNSTQQQAALDFLYSVSLNTGDLYNGTLNGTTSTTNQVANFAIGSGTISDGYCGVATYAASFDAFRAGIGKSPLGIVCYEGFNDSGPVNTNETNGCSSSLATLGYTNGYSSSLSGAASGGPTGSSDTAALAASNMQALLAAFKNDNRFAVLTGKYFTSVQALANVGASRLALPATFGFDGPSVWALYPGSISSTPYQSWNEIRNFNN